MGKEKGRRSGWLVFMLLLLVGVKKKKKKDPWMSGTHP